MSSAPTRRRKNDGFSLIEVIVALALLSAVAALITQSISRTRAIFSAIRQNVASSDVLFAHGYLRAALSQAMPTSSNIATRPPDLVGTSQRIAFRTSYAPQSLVDGIYRVEIGLERSTTRAHGYDLVARSILFRPDPSDPAAGTRSSVLLADVRGILFSFLGPDPQSNGQVGWQSSWSVTDQLPRGVRVQMQFHSGDSRDWPLLEIPLRFAEFAPPVCGGQNC